MNSNGDKNRSESEAGAVDPLERFLDEQMSQEEAEQFLQQAESPEQIENERRLDAELKSSLSRTFAQSPAESDLFVEKMLSLATAPTSDSKSLVNARPTRVSALLRNRFFQIAIAASLLIALFVNWDLLTGTQGGVEFQPRQLASLYKETQSHGFRPYYNCEDPNRFADTFEKRQGQRLVLAEMPEGVKMLGLSYLGGMTPETTAMLAEAFGKQVIVFVDNAGSKETLDAISESSDSGLNVFVREKSGLVFAEVTPHDQPHLIDFFEFE